MPFDGIVTKAVTEELEQNIINGRISKIYQPTDTEVLITIRNNKRNYQLLTSIHPTYARFHLSKEKFANPQEPPMFCMLLRKHINGAIIEAIDQPSLERMITFKLRTVDEIGDTSYRYLVIELMGRHSNLLLLNETKDNIIDSLKHVPATQNRYRTILPGFSYIAPPSQHKINPLSMERDSVIKRLDFNAGKLDKQIVQLVEGFSPFIAKEIVHRARLGSMDSYNDEFLKICEQMMLKKYEPTIYDNEREDFHVLPITYLDGEKQTFSSVNEMLDHFYAGKAERDRVKQQARDLYRFLKNELDKNKRKLKIHEKTLQNSKRAETYQRYGELLTAHMHEVRQGDESITVVNYYDPNQQEVTIPLRPDRTPSENAQAYFTRYRKLTNSKQVVQREIAKTKAEINYLDQLLHQLDRAREADIEDIREELKEEGYLKKQRQRKKKKANKPVPEEYMSSDETAIFVGKNNKQNEYVTHRMAHRNDIWLHAKDIPGSHVIIRSNDPTEKTLLEAAQLAAHFSKAQGSSSVPVDYTKVRHVKKPNGAKPGFVTYDNHQTIFITPDTKQIDKMKR